MKYVTINECDFASTGNIANDILLEFERRGYTCYFANFKNRNKYKYSFRVFNGKFEYQLGRILSKIDGSDGFHNKGATKKLITWLKEIKPDIIHLHNLHGHWINVPMLFNYLKKTDVKILWTFHDCWPLTGRCAHFDFNECSKWKVKCNNCKYMKAYPRSYLFDRSRHFFDLKKELFLSIKDKCTIITPSEWLYNLVKESFLKDFNVRIINNGTNTDLSRYENQTNELINKYNLLNNKIILSLAYPFNERKGIRYIEKCINYFDNKNGDNKKFILIGLNKKQLRYFNNRYSNCLTFGPIFEKSVIISWFKIADVFLNATLEDNFPTVIIESLACGTPIVTFDSGGTAETIRDFPEFVVNKKNLQQLIRNIDLISKNDVLSQSLIELSKRYSVDSMTNQYLSEVIK